MNKKILTILLFCLLVPTVSATIYSPGAPELDISTSYQPFPAEPSNYFTLYVYAVNDGTSTESNIWFQLDADYPFSVEENTKFYGQIASQQKVTLKYDVWVDSDAPEKDYSDKLTLKQCYDSECSVSSDDAIEISVRKLYPVLEISEINFPDSIEPGDKTEVTVVLDNKGGSRLKDITVNLDLSGEDIPIAPYGGSSEKIIQSIDGATKANATFDIIVDGDAESGTYKIPMSLSYYDNSGNSYSKEDILGLVIGGQPSLKVGLEESDYFSEGSIGKVIFNVINIGASTSKFLNLEILPTQEFEVVSTNELYLGNLDSDDYETADFMIKVKQVEGDILSIPVRLTYTDVNNNYFSEEKEVELKLYSSSEISRIQGGNGYTLYIILGILAIGGFFVYKRYFKKKGTK